MNKLCSCIVPCFNEEKVIPIYYDEMQKVMKQEENIEFEIIFVDDGSKDGTLEIMRKLSEQDPKVHYISFSRNFGKEAALYAGLERAKGDYVITMDVDLQDPPYLIPKMIRCIEEENYDSVATRRVTREGEPVIRSFFARQFYKLINKISDSNIVDGARDFRMMKRKMVDAILTMPEYNRFTKGIFGWVGFETKWLEYKKELIESPNPLWNANLNSRALDRSFGVTNNFSAEYNPLTSLKIRGRFGITKTINESDDFLSPEDTSFDDTEELKKGSLAYQNGKNLQYEGELKWNENGDYSGVFICSGILIPICRYVDLLAD